MAHSDLNIRQLIMEELRLLFSQQLESADVLDGKLHGMLQSVGIFTGAAGAIGYLLMNSGQQYMLVILFASFAIVQVFWLHTILDGLSPQIFEYPISSNWDEVWSGFIEKGDDEGYRLLVSNYVARISGNWRIIETKARAVRFSYFAFLANLVLIAIVIFAVIIFHVY